MTNGTKLNGLFTHLRWIAPLVLSLVAAVFAMGAAHGAGKIEGLDSRLNHCETTSKDVLDELQLLRIETAKLQTETVALNAWLERLDRERRDSK